MPEICIDCRYVGAQPSGIGELTLQLARHVPDLAPDYDFLLLRSTERQHSLNSAPNVREIAMRSPVNGPGTMWMLERLVDLKGIDLFHSPANILPARLPMKAVTTVHDIMWLTHPEWCTKSAWGHIERGFYRHGIKRALRRSEKIAVVSEATRAAIIGYDAKVAPRIALTRSGVSADFHPAEPNPQLLAEMGLNPEKRFVLLVGQNAPYKNHAGAVRGFARAFGAHSDIELVAVQRRSAGRNALTSLARSLGLTQRFHVLPPVAKDQLVQLYCAAQVLLHPSFCEGFGNPLAEAMACGCPVIASNQSAMPEVTGGAARLIDPYDDASIADALQEVTSDPALKSRMRKAGLKRARELDWHAFARANIAIYREVLDAA